MEPEQKIVNYNGDDGFEIIEKGKLNDKFSSSQPTNSDINQGLIV